MFDIIPPTYIPPSFPPESQSNNIFGQNHPQFIPPSYIPPSFPPGRNPDHLLGPNHPQFIPPSYIPPSFPPGRIPPFFPPFFPRMREPFFRQNFPFFIPPRMGVNHIKNQKTIEQLEKVEITKKILDKIKIKQCNICLDEYEIGDKISYLPCFHYFHYNCIKDWIEKSEKCPLCNSVIKFE